MYSLHRLIQAPLGLALFILYALSSTDAAQTVAPAEKPAAASSIGKKNYAALSTDQSPSRAKPPVGPGGPAPRLADGHPDFTGLWSPIRETGKPGGNIGKDLPNHQLLFTPAGEAALQFNLTKTVDPEALCILGGIPRHDASGLPFQVIHHPKKLVFLYVYNTHR